MGFWEEFSKRFQSSPAGAVGRAGNDVLDIFGNLLAVPGAPGPMQAVASGQSNSAPAPVTGDPRKAVEYMIHSDRSLTDAQRSQLMQWLQGQPLMDPALVEKVNSVTMGQPVEGAGTKIAGPANPLPGMNPGAGLVDEFGAQLTGPGAGTSQRPSEAGISFLRNEAPPPPPAVNTSNATTPPPPSNAPPGAGPTDTSGAALLENPDIMMRYVAREAGLNPERGGMASNFFRNFTGPTVAALQGLYDFLPGQGEGMDYGQIGGNFANFGKSFITPGQSGLANARAYAAQIAGNPEFREMIGGVDDGTQMQRLEQLMALKNAGARGLRESWLNRQYENLVDRYQDSEMGLLPGATYGGYGGDFTKFLAQNPELAQRLFGFAR